MDTRVIVAPPPPEQMATTVLPLPRTSGGRAQVVEGSTPHFTDAISSLRRRRLRIAALSLAGVLFLGLLTTLSLPGLPLRIIVLLIVAACVGVLWAPRPLSAGQIRAIDLTVLGGFVVQSLYMPDVLMLERARAGDYATVVMDRYFNIGSWAMFLVVYGLFIPNSWQRALAILAPLSLVPELNFYLLGLYEPKVQEAFDSLHHGAPVPLTLIAALVGTYGAHTIYSIRRDAFRARQLGQYRLREKLGSGGMGEVFRAEHAMLKRPCAIKLLRPDLDAHADGVARFEREVQATARLTHPNTVEIYDYGRTDEGIFYYVMELLEGLSLAELVKRHGPLPADRAVYLLRQVCAALREAHGLGLVHRDIKPANIFAARQGGLDDVAKLLDFGLVKESHNRGDAQITREGMISGSPAYMSPEQATAGEQIDPRSDIYSLGAVAYDLLTGGPPFLGKNPLEVIVAHARDPVVPPSVRNDAVPADLETVVLRCLQKKPEDRFPDVVALDRALAECACAAGWNAERAAEWWRSRMPGSAANGVSCS